MAPEEILEFLEKWQSKVIINRYGVTAKVDGMTANGMFVLCTFVGDPQADDKHPSRIGHTGMCLPSSLGRVWKESQDG